VSKYGTLVVSDLGLFTGIVETLAPHFERTFYTSPGWESPYQRLAPCSVGDGIPGITRINSIDDVYDQKADLYLFPDIAGGATQMRLASQGQRVWGGRMGEEIELKREAAKKLMASKGIPIGPYTVIVGTESLITYLKPRKDVWIKTDTYRGDMETWHYLDWKISEGRLRRECGKFDPYAGSTQRFIVEQNLVDSVEVAIDTYAIDDQFPDAALVGIETKGTGYLARFMTWPTIPKQLTAIYENMGPLLKRYRYRQLFALEIRITPDGKPNVTDPCMRFGFLPSEAIQVSHSNLAQIMYEGAGGRLVQPICKAPWVAALVLSSDQAQEHQLPVRYPDSVAPFVKLRQYGMRGGVRYVFPGDVKTPTIGAVVGLGPTADAAMKQCVEHAKLVQADGVEYESKALDEAYENFAKLKGFGYPVPGVG
jgi:hypothetical protein